MILRKTDTAPVPFRRPARPSSRSGLGLTRLSAAASLALAAASFAATLGTAQAETTLLAVPSTDLAILDPVWTTAAITHEHAFLIYDTLFNIDSAGKAQPQMVDSYTVSDDGLTYSFTLRDGLKFHDGSPIEAADAVASIKRWSQRRPEGQLMNSYGALWEAADAKTFTLKLDKPYGNVEAALGDSTRPVFVMREEEASTDAFEQLKTTIGSGPFMFDEAAWRPGSKVVYHKFADYLPRDEPVDGFAGGHVAGVDTIEWTVIPDSATAVNALVAGEVDLAIAPTPDLLPMLDANPDITTLSLSPVGLQGMLRPNHLAPPMDKAAMRKAVYTVVQNRQEEYLSAMIGLPQNYRVCLSPLVCGHPFETSVGEAQFKDIDLKASVKALLDEAGYDGTPIVVLDPTDQHIMHNMVLVFAQHLREVGINVDLQALDWGTMTKRRTTKAGPGEDSNGYHIFPTWWGANSMQNPLTNIPLNTTEGGKNWYGWPSNPAFEALRLSYADARTDAEKQAIMDQLQTQFFDYVPYIHVGQFFRPLAYRTDRLDGIVTGGATVYWNITKAD